MWSCPISVLLFISCWALLSSLRSTNFASRCYRSARLHFGYDQSKQVGGKFRSSVVMSVTTDYKSIDVMINGLPGLMALEVAKVCIERGFNVIPVGFTGPRTQTDSIVVEAAGRSVAVELLKGPGVAFDAIDRLAELKVKYPMLIAIDYTHPSAVVDNLICYAETSCDFVMGTTGVDQHIIEDSFSKGTNYAVVAPNMAKQIVALQATLLTMAQRFPGSFHDYELTVIESHQSSKADTSGTAKAVVSSLAQLNGKNFNTEHIIKLRDKEQQLSFNVPEEALSGHAFHTYRLTSSDKSVSFELQHNVCGRRIYAEGTADAVQFLDSVRTSSPSKRLYNMINVLEQGNMS